MNPTKRIKLDKEAEDSKTGIEYQITVEQTFVYRKLETSWRSQNNPIMLQIRDLLKSVLSKFLSDEMNPSVWFIFQTKSLEELIKGMMQWNHYEFLTEKDKANIVLLHEKFSRLSFDDEDECLTIISAVQDLFRAIQNIRPNLFIPLELIQEYRAAYINNFTAYNDAASQFPSPEEKNVVYELLSDTWVAINHICGVILDHYEIPHDFVYCGKNRRYSDLEIRHLIVIAYPNVHRIRRLFRKIFDAGNRCKPVKSLTNTLATALLEFIPSLNLPVEPKTYSFFNALALENWLTSFENKSTVERAIMQIDKYCSKLEEAFNVMANFNKGTNT